VSAVVVYIADRGCF